MIGVFVSFTLSQAGMVMRLAPAARAGLAHAAQPSTRFGATVTGIVLVVVAVTKAHEGAWIIMLLIPLHVLFFRMTRTPLRRRGGAALAQGLEIPLARAATPCSSRSAASSRRSSRRSTTRRRCRPTCAPST